MAAICQHRLEVHGPRALVDRRVAYVCSRVEHPGDPWHEVELPTEKGAERLLDVDENDMAQWVSGSRFRWRSDDSYTLELHDRPA